MPKLDCQKVAGKIIKFLKQEVRDAGFTKVIIPLSGGLDSSVVAFLAVKALEVENVLIALLPNKDINKDQDAKLVISKLAIPNPPAGKNIFEIEISNVVQAFQNSLGDLTDLRKGNLMARIRMTILYDLAKKHQVLVCGTENKSEYLLGYFTRFGDQAADLEPIRNLYKTQVIELAKHLGVPEKIINKPPTANLWSGQTDENELGFSYKDADPILFYRFDQKLAWERIIELGFKKELVKKVRDQVERNKFKQETPKIIAA
ncbi:MAG: NAD+ synthase [Candidatus Gottesmanbacteria bacterium]